VSTLGSKPQTNLAMAERVNAIASDINCPQIFMITVSLYTAAVIGGK
jgi:hypothetical protein